VTGFDHFNFIGPIYDRIFGRHEDVEILDLAETSPDQRILDVGGGTGRVSVLFKRQGANIWIADAARKMLYQAVEKDLPVVETVSEHLPFKSGCFDRVILVDALHHVVDQGQTLSEMWRVLSPGGRIIIEEPDIRNFFVKLIALGEKLMLMRSHFLAPKTIAAMGKKLSPENVDVVCKNGIAWVIITKAI
jgi:demethylmenaquinone methyltransferase/2-methoxy-6-polyprenyl-1,4-benzoquinol methylase